MNLLISYFLVIAIWSSVAKKDKSNDYVEDYGFVAYLFNKQNATPRCTGAIVAASWILNYCEFGELPYNAVRVGVTREVSRSQVKDYIYNLDKREVYPGHKIIPFPQIDKDYDLRNLYASTNSVFLDHTEEQMKLITEFVRPIVLSRIPELPKKAMAIFFPKSHKQTDAIYKVLHIVDNSECNEYYQKYNLSIDKDTNFCVDSSRLTYEECCASHAIMVYHDQLIGMVTWSTACWSPPEPWVLTKLGPYYKWLVKFIGGNPLLEDKMRNG